MKEVLIASNNAHKISEISAILKGKFDKIYSLRDLNLACDPEECGKTFYENALIKAKAAYELSKMPAIADDSGLSVDALGGAPGIYSARFAGEPCDDKKNNDLLLLNMKNITDRRAKFVSSIVFYDGGKIISAEAVLEGEILLAPRGESGFGYDPLFYIPELKKTMAEIGPSGKNKISHRAKALAEFSAKLI